MIGPPREDEVKHLGLEDALPGFVPLATTAELRKLQAAVSALIARVAILEART